MSPLVSVVIPTYNHAHFLGRALESVVTQTYPLWEALVVDNHSQDTTDQIVQAAGDPRIRLLKIHNHGVIAASRNLGMREARGEWIAFLDSDDCWYSRKLEAAVAAGEADGGYDVVSNDEWTVDIKTGTRARLRHGPYEEKFYEALLLEGNRLSPSATLVRRDFLGRHGLTFDEAQDRVTVEDYGFWLDLAQRGARFKFIPDILGEFVVHGANNSSQLARHWKNAKALLRDHVFDRQKFHPAPDKLWALIRARLSLVEARQFVADRKLSAGLLLAMRTLASSPRGTALYLGSKLKSRWRRGPT